MRGKHRFLSRARFYSQNDILEFLRRTGFCVVDVESGAGFSVIAAEAG